MSLTRMWRRQLFGASTAALIVPTAMLAALLALALGGAFGGVGVLGQLFAGPSLSLGIPGAHAGAGVSGNGARGAATDSLPVIPAVAPAPAVVGGTRPGRTNLTASRGTSGAGGAIGGGGTVRPVTLGGGSDGSGGYSGSGSGSGAGSPSPSPGPSPTPVDAVVKVVTSVTKQVPEPAGPVVTQAVRAAGSAADNLLPLGGQPAPAPLVAGSPAGRLSVP